MRSIRSEVLFDVNESLRARISEIRQRLATLPKTEIGGPSTPVDSLPNVSADLGLDVCIKREDAAGPTFGGIYSRALEYVFGEVEAKGSKGVVQSGPSHSNQCRLIAAICARLGLQAHLVLRKRLHLDQFDQGNLFLSQLHGAHVTWVDAELGDELDRQKEERYQALRAEGVTDLYLFQRERVTALGCLGVLDFFLQLYEQLDRLKWIPKKIYLCGCGPAQSGLELGNRMLDTGIEITGVRPLHKDGPEAVASQVNAAAALLDFKIRARPREIRNIGDYVGDDYGIVTPEANAAIEYFARKDGVLLDPVYTGKMAACFLDDSRSQVIIRGSRILLLHTGGLPLTVLYSREIAASLGYHLAEPKEGD